MNTTIKQPGGPGRGTGSFFRRIEHWRWISLFLTCYDIVVVNLSYIFTLWIRFDAQYTHIPENYKSNWMNFTLIYTVFCILLFSVMRLYRMVWRFVGYPEIFRIAATSVLASMFHAAGITILFGRMPLSYYIFGGLVQLVMVLGIRMSYRIFLMFRESRSHSSKDGGSAKRVMLIGAGSAGQMILKDIKKAREVDYKVVCFIDDLSNKWGRFIEGVPVEGGRESIMEAVKKYNVDVIFLTIPSASAQERRDILNICKETGCELRNMPGMYQLVRGDVTVSAMKKVSLEDLLGRDPIQPNMTEVFSMLQGKVVLVTGGGGSIGSELCRQIAAHDPKQLIIFDVYENNAYNIQLELRDKYPHLDLVTLIGSVRDSRKMYQVFKRYRPQIVYHAAAHKHVPLMEDSPCEAIKNNVVGTYKTAYAAMVHGCERFVLISTDKAVNPTNIMGASKRLCEMVIQSFDAKIKDGKADEIPQLFTHMGYENADKDGTGNVFKNIRTEFVAVRFGNVLGSNGSVIPIFRHQIEKGGPVTVTHPDIIRYFMTIPEAVSLVLTAGTYASGGEIFVLDMGSPVKIDTLARNMIRLSGFKPDVDIKIEYTGLRPGEKLYEEKLMSEEGLKKTANELIFIGKPIPFDRNEFLGKIKGLMDAAYQNQDNIRELVAEVVSTYHPAKNN